MYSCSIHLRPPCIVLFKPLFALLTSYSSVSLNAVAPVDHVCVEKPRFSQMSSTPKEDQTCQPLPHNSLSLTTVRSHLLHLHPALLRSFLLRNEPYSRPITSPRFFPFLFLFSVPSNIPCRSFPLPVSSHYHQNISLLWVINLITLPITQVPYFSQESKHTEPLFFPFHFTSQNLFQ